MTSIPPIVTPFGFQSTAAEVLAEIDLSGKRAIVTGAASGIGVETARALARPFTTSRIDHNSSETPARPTDALAALTDAARPVGVDGRPFGRRFVTPMLMGSALNPINSEPTSALG
jgi:hypothetical protein